MLEFAVFLLQVIGIAFVVYNLIKVLIKYYPEEFSDGEQ